MGISSGSASIVIKLESGWGESRKRLKKLPVFLRETIAEGLADYANYGRKLILLGIMRSLLPTKNNMVSPYTRDKKARKGRPQITLVDTGEYLASLRIVRSRKFAEKDTIAEVWLQTSGRRRNAYIAMVHEYGLQGLPERPHWRPVFALLKRRESEFGWHVQSQLMQGKF